MIGSPPTLVPLYCVVALLTWQHPVWRRKIVPLELLRSHEKLRRAVQRDVICGFGRIPTQIARHMTPRVLHYQIYVRLLIDVVEKRKRGRKYEDADCSYRTKQ